MHRYRSNLLREDQLKDHETEIKYPDEWLMCCCIAKKSDENKRLWRARFLYKALKGKLPPFTYQYVNCTVVISPELQSIVLKQNNEYKAKLRNNQVNNQATVGGAK